MRRKCVVARAPGLEVEGEEEGRGQRCLSSLPWPSAPSGLRSGLVRQSTEHASAVCVSS